MTRSDALEALTNQGDPTTAAFTKSVFDLNKPDVQTAEALLHAALALDLDQEYHARVVAWLNELGRPVDGPVPVPEPVPSPLPEPEPIPAPTPAPEVGGKWETRAVQHGTAIHATFTAPEDFTGNALVDVELFDAKSERVHQSFTDTGILHDGDTFGFVAKPEPTLPEGSYVVRLGVFAPGWAQLYDWNNEAGTYVVEAAEQEPEAEPTPDEPEPEPQPKPVEEAPATPAPVQPAEAEFYVDGGQAAREADKLEQEGRTEEAGWVREAIAEQPQAIWWNGGDVSHIRKASAAAKAAGKKAIFVAYNIPDRDAGQWSKGGARNVADYKVQFDQFAEAIGDTPAFVPIEPDATNLPDVLSPERIECLNYAMKVLSEKPNVHAYVDAGHSNWRSTDEMAERLNSLVIPDNVGISLNVSSWQSTESSIKYGKELTPKLNGSSKRMVIDTSRNGMEQWPVYEWCNVRDSKAGTPSTTDTGDEAVDALLWIKRPGESDGQEVDAGQWYSEWAVGFAKRSVGA